MFTHKEKSATQERFREEQEEEEEEEADFNILTGEN